MNVPAPVVELHIPHALFHQAACKQTVLCKAGFGRIGDAVALQRLWLFFADVGDFRDCHLHAIGKLILLGTGDGFAVTGACRVEFVQG